MKTILISITLTLLLTACGGGGSTNEDIILPDKPTATPAPPLASVYSKLNTTNNAHRSGYYYLPTGYNQSELPLMLIFHGTNYDGKYMVELFKNLAETTRFIILAPDSNRSTPEWQSGNRPGQITQDFKHVENCINELLSKSNVRIDMNKVLSSGWSGGGWFATYFATNNSLIKSFANLHGGVTLESLGTNKVPGFFTSGDSDGICSPPFVHYFAHEMGLMGFSTVYKTFSSDHYIHNQEKQELIAWWLTLPQ